MTRVPPVRVTVRSLTFDVFGDAVPQGSKRAIVNRHTGKPAVIESGGARLRTWRSDVVAAARSAMSGQGPFEGPVTLFVVFHLRRPKRPKNEVPIVRPDVDKLARGLLDALAAAGVFHDDAQVTDLSVRKRYSDEPRAYVAVSEEKLDIVERVR